MTPKGARAPDERNTVSGLFNSGGVKVGGTSSASASCIGRLGALAVALGVSVAIATMNPAVAFATPADSGTSSTSTDSDGAAAGKPSAPSTSGASAQDTKDADPAAVTDSAGDADSTTTAGGTSRTDTNTKSGSTKKNSPTSGKRISTRSAPRAQQDDQQTTKIADDDAPSVSAATRVAPARPVRAADGPSLLSDVPASAQRVFTTVAAAVRGDGDASQPSALVTRTSAAAPTRSPARAASVVVDVVTDLTSAAFGPGAAGQDSPAAPSPAALAVLGFVRRETDQQAATSVVPLALVQQQATALPFPEWIRDFFTGILADVVNGITPLIANRTPRTVQQQVSTATDQATGPIKFNATDPDGDRMNFFVNETGPGAPKHGTVTINQEDGTFVYTPTAGYTGVDYFTYTANDDTDLHIHGPLDWTSAFAGHQNGATVTVFVGQADTSKVSGSFDLLTYNVADLPWPLSSAAVERTSATRQISTLLNDYDIVNVQEDFAYHQDLISSLRFPFQNTPFPPTVLWPLGVPFNSGVNSFSSFYIEQTDRQSWDVCTLENCLTPKGFTMNRVVLPGGEKIDIYNLHADTNRYTAVNDNLDQLTAYIQQHSSGNAVIVTGDFNTQYSTPGNALGKFATDNGLKDVDRTNPPCATVCDDGLDKVFYRSAPGVQLQATQIVNESSKFVTPDWQGLSDSSPIKVRFDYVADNVFIGGS